MEGRSGLMPTITQSRESEDRCTDEKQSQCPCLGEGTFHQCEARWGKIRPTATELTVYCLDATHVVCPVFKRFGRTGRPLTRWEYTVEKLKQEQPGLPARDPGAMSFES